MHAINASIREAENSFRLAGAGVDKFGSNLSGQLAKVQMLDQTSMLQSAAVKQHAEVERTNAVYAGADAAQIGIVIHPHPDP